MHEHESPDFKTFIAGRLLKQTDDFDEVELRESEAGVSSEKSADDTVAVTAIASIATPSPTRTDESDAAAFAKVDKSLISLGFFTPSSRRIKNQKIKAIRFTRTDAGKKVEASVEFHPSPVYGLPITADQDKFLALHHIITNLLRENGTITNPIRFTSAEMLRLLDKKRQSGKNYHEIAEWLACMTTTSIISKGVVYKAGEKRFAQDVFHVFSRATSVGKEMPDGKIADANYVWLSDWQLENINEKYLLPIDVVAYRKVKNHIAKALIPLLQVWLFASQRARRYEKKYDELCEMLGLQVFKAPSRITQQLKASFDELVQYEYLEKWRIERTADKRQFKIVFFHGAKFDRDQQRRLQEKAVAEDVLVVAESEPLEPNLPEPGRIETSEPQVPRKRGRARAKSEAAAKPYVATPAVRSLVSVEISNSLDIQNSDNPEVETSETVEARLIDELSARGLMPSVAMKLLRGVTPEQLEAVFDYIDYYDHTKKAKDVGPGFLHTLIRDGSLLPSNFETRRKREELRAAQRREYDLVRLKQEIDRGYEDHCGKMVDRFIAEELPIGEFDRRVAERKRELVQQGGFWDGPNRDEITAKMALREVRAEISAGVAVSYQDFYRRHLPEAAAKLGLDPDEFGLKPSPTAQV